MTSIHNPPSTGQQKVDHAKHEGMAVQNVQTKCDAPEQRKPSSLTKQPAQLSQSSHLSSQKEKAQPPSDTPHPEEENNLSILTTLPNQQPERMNLMESQLQVDTEEEKNTLRSTNKETGGFVSECCNDEKAQDGETKLQESCKPILTDEEFFKRKLIDLIKVKELDSSLYQVVSNDNGVHVKCKPCGAMVAAGQRHRSLCNFSRHILRESHKIKTQKMIDGLAKRQSWKNQANNETAAKLLKRKREVDKKEVVEVMAKRAKVIESKHSGIF